jgi:hypothetical protein
VYIKELVLEGAKAPKVTAGYTVPFLRTGNREQFLRRYSN